MKRWKEVESKQTSAVKARKASELMAPSTPFLLMQSVFPVCLIIKSLVN